MNRMKRLMSLIFMTVLVVMVLSSCKQQGEDVKKVKDLDFTVVEEEDIPKELMTIINQKKEKPFKLSVASKGKEYLYIVVGYGVKNTGGFSISVENLYLTENAIYLDTTLIGPAKDEMVTQVFTYPYLVLKTEYMDKSVLFQ